MYFYLKNSGLWGRYRWTGLVFGAVVSAVALLLCNNRNDNLGLRVSILFCAAGIIVLLHFLVQHGGSEQGFLASLLLGFAAQGLYAHYKTRLCRLKGFTPIRPCRLRKNSAIQSGEMLHGSSLADVVETSR